MRKPLLLILVLLVVLVHQPPSAGSSDEALTFTKMTGSADTQVGLIDTPVPILIDYDGQGNLAYTLYERGASIIIDGILRDYVVAGDSLVIASVVVSSETYPYTIPVEVYTGTGLAEDKDLATIIGPENTTGIQGSYTVSGSEIELSGTVEIAFSLDALLAAGVSIDYTSLKDGVTMFSFIDNGGELNVTVKLTVSNGEVVDTDLILSNSTTTLTYSPMFPKGFVNIGIVFSDPTYYIVYYCDPTYIPTYSINVTSHSSNFKLVIRGEPTIRRIVFYSGKYYHDYTSELIDAFTVHNPQLPSTISITFDLLSPGVVIENTGEEVLFFRTTSDVPVTFIGFQGYNLTVMLSGYIATNKFTITEPSYQLSVELGTKMLVSIDAEKKEISALVTRYGEIEVSQQELFYNATGTGGNRTGLFTYVVDQGLGVMIGGAMLAGIAVGLIRAGWKPGYAVALGSLLAMMFCLFMGSYVGFVTFFVFTFMSLALEYSRGG